MIRIGEFSILTSISINMLRNYDKIGLLVPKYVDNESSYRYYDKSQLAQANQINAMKSMGIGLDDIIKIMSLKENEINNILEDYLNNKKNELIRIKNQITQLESVINYKKDKKCLLSIAKKQMHEMIVVSYANDIVNYTDEGILWNKLRELTNKNNIELNEDDFTMSINHGINEDNDKMRVEVQIMVDKMYNVKSPLEIKKIEKREVASIIFNGKYSQISEYNIVVAQWLEDNKLSIISDKFYIYHKGPNNCNDENKYITEICYPIKKSIDSHIV